MDITGYRVWELHEAFGVRVFVPGSTIPFLLEAGLPVDGLIDIAAEMGQRKWMGIGDLPVLFRGNGAHSDRFLALGWTVEAVAGRPLMPDTKGKGERVDHVPGFEPVWLLATPGSVAP